MTNILEVSVESKNQKMQFEGVLRDNPPIRMDYIPPLGDGQGYMPLELILMSLATCSGATVSLLLRNRARKNVTDIRVNAKGIRREEHPTSFRSIALEFIVSADDVDDDLMRQILQVSEETYCPVWAMLQGNVEITAEFRVVRPTA